MKFSFMSFSTPDLSLQDTLNLAKKLGYDGVEPRLDAGHKHGVELEIGALAREKIKDLSKKSGIELACLATSCRYADPATNAESVEVTHECIDLAGDLEVPRIRVFGGKFPEDVTRQQAIDLLIESLEKVKDHAKERNVKVCLETHDAWCDPNHLALVLKAVGHPNIGANWDIMHPVRQGYATIEESFNILKPWIYHLHIHDAQIIKGNAKLTPIGTGNIDHKTTLKLLKSISYDGYLSGEWIKWQPYELHLPREIKLLVELEQELL